MTMIEVVNRQRKLPIDCERWQAFATKASRVLPGDAAGVTIAFVSDRAMRELNRLWRHKRGPRTCCRFQPSRMSLKRLKARGWETW